MKTTGILWISAGILIIALFFHWLSLSLTVSDIWMSPDETANVASAINYAKSGIMGFESQVTRQFAWAHPRSFIFVPETSLVAPVGFLGMPLILSLMYKLFGLLGVNFFAPLLALATLYPLWRLMPKTWPGAVKFMSIIIWMSFPPIILYANRGTFPQLTQLCLVIWSWWLITHAPYRAPGTKSWKNFFYNIEIPLAGVVTALGLIIRPVEAIWIIPVIVLAFLFKDKIQNPNSTAPALPISPPAEQGKTSGVKYDARKLQLRLKSLLLFLLPLLLILLIGAKLGHETYGKWLVSGYQIRPTISNMEHGTQDLDSISGPQTPNSDQIVMEEVREDREAYSNSASFISTLPFGFHPRHIWWNVKNYYLWLLLPWISLALGSILILIKEQAWKSERRWSLAAVIWPVIAVTIFYGNGIYQDHVRLNEISLGNSFLRYTLPISVAVMLASGYVFARIWRYWSLKIFAVCLTAGLVFFGIWIANVGYDDSLFYAKQELLAYQKARVAALHEFSADGLVLSDRSDKIFFPELWAVSPIPTPERIKQLMDNDYKMRLYLPTQDKKGLLKWEKQGFIMRAVFTTGNQTLYDVY